MVVPLLSKAGYYAVLAVVVLFPQLEAGALMGTYFLDQLEENSLKRHVKRHVISLNLPQITQWWFLSYPKLVNMLF